MSADYIYQEVYKLCLKAGVKSYIAQNKAVQIADQYKKNKYTGKLSKLIEQAIKDAVKESKRDK